MTRRKILNGYRDLATILILIGGTLGLASALIALTMVPFMAGVLGYGYITMWEYGEMIGRYGMFGYPEFGLALMTEVMFVWSLLGIAGALLSIFCGFKLRQKWVRNVVFIGLVGVFLQLLVFSLVSSLLVLAGTILAYVERD